MLPLNLHLLELMGLSDGLSFYRFSYLLQEVGFRPLPRHSIPELAPILHFSSISLLKSDVVSFPVF